MPNAKPIRCDEWNLQTDAETLRMASDTVARYRKLANALATVFLTHWPEVHALPVQDLESYFHNTAKTKGTHYGLWFARNFHKVPSYLRRAATMAAHGAVSSYMTRYQAWQTGNRTTRKQRPPLWGGMRSWPVLYAANGGAGAMIRHNGNIASIKLLDIVSGDWLWRNAVVIQRGKRHTALGAVPKSPSLVLRGAKLSLAQPYEFPRRKRERKPADRVCAIDQGINKQGTCSIVDRNGTVIARKFIHLAAHIDRRDKALRAIQTKARQTMGNGGKLSKGFCRTLYKRAQGLNLHIARELSRQALAFATVHGARTIVFEDLKGFRPKGGGKKRSGLRQKFHGWLHRLVVKQAQQSGEEHGLEIAFVFPRGTSAWAYDGSGRVVRDKSNYGQCRFVSGKHYDCDLSASYNIAARWFARTGQLPAGGKTGWPARGRRSGLRRSSTAGPRMPVTLSALWATPVVQGSEETPTTTALAA